MTTGASLQDSDYRLMESPSVRGGRGKEVSRTPRRDGGGKEMSKSRAPRSPRNPKQFKMQCQATYRHTEPWSSVVISSHSFNLRVQDGCVLRHGAFKSSAPPLGGCQRQLPKQCHQCERREHTRYDSRTLAPRGIFPVDAILIGLALIFFVLLPFLLFPLLPVLWYRNVMKHFPRYNHGMTPRRLAQSPAL